MTRYEVRRAGMLVRGSAGAYPLIAVLMDVVSNDRTKNHPGLGGPRSPRARSCVESVVDDLRWVSGGRNLSRAVMDGRALASFSVRRTHDRRVAAVSHTHFQRAIPWVVVASESWVMPRSTLEFHAINLPNVWVRHPFAGTQVSHTGVSCSYFRIYALKTWGSPDITALGIQCVTLKSSFRSHCQMVTHLWPEAIVPHANNMNSLCGFGDYSILRSVASNSNQCQSHIRTINERMQGTAAPPAADYATLGRRSVYRYSLRPTSGADQTTPDLNSYTLRSRRTNIVK